MYAHSNTAFSRASTTTTTTLPSSASPPLIHHHLPTLTEFDSLFKLHNSEITSSSSSCYGNNAASPTTNLSNFFAEVLYSDHAPVTRVYSTSHLQRTNEMQHNNNSSESSLSSECSIIIEGMNRACRYSPDEKKARIERYRSKRKQRNFNKKIKYACRKTLADSRPRIRGRFARNNEEADNNHPAQWHHIGGGEEEDEEYENWVSIYDSLVAANLAQESEDSSSFGLLY